MAAPGLVIWLVDRTSGGRSRRYGNPLLSVSSKTGKMSRRNERSHIPNMLHHSLPKVTDTLSAVNVIGYKQQQQPSFCFSYKQQQQTSFCFSNKQQQQPSFCCSNKQQQQPSVCCSNKQQQQPSFCFSKLDTKMGSSNFKYNRNGNKYNRNRNIKETETTEKLEGKQWRGTTVIIITVKCELREQIVYVLVVSEMLRYIQGRRDRHRHDIMVETSGIPWDGSRMSQENDKHASRDTQVVEINTAREHESEVTAREHVNQSTAREHESEVTAREHESEVTAREHESEVTAREHDSENTAREHESENTAREQESENTAREQESENTAREQESENTARELVSQSEIDSQLSDILLKFYATSSCLSLCPSRFCIPLSPCGHPSLKMETANAQRLVTCEPQQWHTATNCICQGDKQLHRRTVLCLTSLWRASKNQPTSKDLPRTRDHKHGGHHLPAICLKYSTQTFLYYLFLSEVSYFLPTASSQSESHPGHMPPEELNTDRNQDNSHKSPRLLESLPVSTNMVGQTLQSLQQTPTATEYHWFLLKRRAAGSVVEKDNLGKKVVGVKFLVASSTKKHRRANSDDALNILSSLKLHKSRSERDSDVFRSKELSFMCDPSGFQPSIAHRTLNVNMLPSAAHGIRWALFEKETMRLASFSLYPASAMQSAAMLAGSGFVYIGDGVSDRVKCFFCSAEKESWQEADNIDQVHMALSPTCPMVIVQTTNNVASNNSTRNLGSITNYSSAVPCFEATALSGQASQDNRPTSGGQAAGNSARGSSSASRHGETMSSSSNETRSNAHGRPQRQSADRRDSAVASGSESSTSGRPQGVDQTDNGLARDGNTDASRQDSRESAANLDISSSRHQAHQPGNPAESVPTHQNINSQIYSIPTGASNTSDPDTPARSSTPPSAPGSTPATSNVDPQLTYQLLGIFHERPKHIQYAVLSRRLQTFESWPGGHPLKKDDLAKSGLFYAGYGDCCRCFSCGGGLRNWEDNDDPRVEHARWFPKCSFLRQHVGDDFVKAVQALAGSRDCIRLGDVTEHMKRAGKAEYITDESSITEDAAVKSVIQAGYDSEIVERMAKNIRDSGELLSADVILQALREAGAKSRTGAAAGGEDLDSRGTLPDEGRLQTLKEQNYALRNNLICKICMDKEVRVVFLPCGHLVCCQECAAALLDCPLCRRHIRATTMAYISK